MDIERARAVFGAERIARLATVSAEGIPHLVPVTFDVQRDQVVIAIDHKPKTTTNLRRLRNIRQNPRVVLLVDHYNDDDWTHLWWVRADGTAAVHEDGPRRDAAIRGLCGKYDQYRERTPEGPVILVDVTRWSGWSYSE